MRLFVVGGSGRTGQSLIAQGLAGGHALTVLVRDPARFGVPPDGVVLQPGDLMQEGSLAGKVAGHDAVIAVLAPTGNVLQIRRPTELFSTGGKNLVQAMAQQGVRRLIFVTSAGIVRDDPATQGFTFRWIFEPLLLRHMYDDARRFEAELHAEPHGLEWTLVHPPALTDGPLTGTYRVSEGWLPPGGKELSRADLAHFLLSLAVGGDRVHQTAAVAS